MPDTAMPADGALPEAVASGPNEAPMSTPQQPLGDEAVATVHVHIAMEALENTLPMFGSTSDKGRAVLEVLRKLAGVFGGTDAEAKQLGPAEIQQLLSGAGGQSGPGDVAVPNPQPAVGQVPGPTPG